MGAADDSSVQVHFDRLVPSSGAVTAQDPLDDEGFAALMEPLGPFERRPHVAVAVSGGADSMALALLARAWVAARGGRLLALTVDHGLRPESHAEAATVGRWLRERGIAHEVLIWRGPKPETGRQEAARAARYRLLLDRCRDAGIVHLLLGHHRDDQAETVLLRLAAGSTLDGLAAMAEIGTAPYARLLRPLLTVSRASLEAMLTARGQEWIDDPSNRNTAFQRVRLRGLLPKLAEAGLGAERWAGFAGQAAAARMALDEAAAIILARSVALSPMGFARIDREVLLEAPPAVARRALDRVLRAVAGAAYGPRAERLERIRADIQAGLEARRSLGGCLLAPGRDGLLVQREPAAIAGPVAVQAGGAPALWDGRFMVWTGGRGTARIGALGAAGWLAIKGETASHRFPAAVLATLPALIDRAGEPLQVPHLGWRRRGERGTKIARVAFAPLSPLTGGLVWHDAGIMC